MLGTRVVALAAACLLLGSPRVAAGQEPQDDSVTATRLMVSRDTLQSILQRLDGSGSGGSGSDSGSRSGPRAPSLAQQIRLRLERGDFQPGDRLRLQVDSEPQLSDTFPVGPNQELVLPVIGVLSLHGVLRAELQGAMTRELSRFLRDPIVRA